MVEEILLSLDSLRELIKNMADCNIFDFDQLLIKLKFEQQNIIGVFWRKPVVYLYWLSRDQSKLCC